MDLFVVVRCGVDRPEVVLLPEVSTFRTASIAVTIE
jgi:hypothetical protein